MKAIETRLRRQIEAVRSGALHRRAFIARCAAAGLSAPMANLLLLDAGLAQTPAATPDMPTRRGGGGALKLLFWQGPTLLNPHFATGDKDLEGSRPFYESLIRWDPEGKPVPVLAAQLPTRDNGGVAADGKSVIWQLKPGVRWHDGQPFTADDVVFNWRYASQPDTAAITSGVYQGLVFEKLDAHTLRVRFDKPAPFWIGPYARLQLIPQHLFAPYIGARSREAPNNLQPVGTGPYKFLEFKPGDRLRAVLNPDYHQPNRPHFETLELKGGGDAVSAARAVLQTGEFDYAWYLLVEEDVLRRLESAGKGRVVFAAGSAVEFMMLNFADPVSVVDGERASPKSRHPLFSDPAVRRALALLVDRKGIEQYIYGRAGRATANYLNSPERYRSPNTRLEFSIDKANALLDAAGWKPGTDGVRQKDGKRLSLLFQTPINAPRQKIQQIVKQAAQKAGIDMQLKAVVGSAFFSSDVGNPDTAGKFWADIQMYERNGGQPDPERLMQAFVSWEASSKANKWQGRNVMRWRNEAFDAAYRAAEVEMDPVKRTALFIRMNDLICSECVAIPISHRAEVGGLSNKLVAELSGWDDQLSSLANWYRETP